jgi:hypothetical protein
MRRNAIGIETALHTEIFRQTDDTMSDGPIFGGCDRLPQRISVLRVSCICLNCVSPPTALTNGCVVAQQGNGRKRRTNRTLWLPDDFAAQYCAGNLL